MKQMSLKEYAESIGTTHGALRKKWTDEKNRLPKNKQKSYRPHIEGATMKKISGNWIITIDATTMQK